MGTTAEQRLGRVVRHAEPDRRQQSGGYAEYRLQRRGCDIAATRPWVWRRAGDVPFAARPTSIANRTRGCRPTTVSIGPTAWKPASSARISAAPTANVRRRGKTKFGSATSTAVSRRAASGFRTSMASSRQRLRVGPIGRLLQQFARTGADGSHDEHRHVVPQRRPVPEIRRGRPQSERLQCQVQLRHRPCATPASACSARHEIPRVGIRTQRPLQTNVPVGGAQLAAITDHERLRLLLVSAGRTASAGIQPNACVIGNFYYFFSDGSVQTNATGVPPPPGTTLASTQQVQAANWTIALRDGFGRQSALSNQPRLGRRKTIATRSRVWLSLRVGPGHVGRRLHLFERPHENQVYGTTPRRWD